MLVLLIIWLVLIVLALVAMSIGKRWDQHPDRKP